MDLVAQYIYRREGPFSTGPSFPKISKWKKWKKGPASPLVQLFDPWHMVEMIRGEGLNGILICCDEIFLYVAMDYLYGM